MHSEFLTQVRHMANNIRTIAIVTTFAVAMSVSDYGYSLTDESGASTRTLQMPVESYLGGNKENLANTREITYWMARDLIDRGDLIKGLEMLRSAADSGQPFAMHDLALLLGHRGDKQSMVEAARWYRLSAEVGGIGFAGSQNNLGDMYENGHGLPKSPGDAIYWYVRSAMQGEPTAYLSLGFCFADGVGVQIDPVEAAFWLLLAVRELHEGSNRNDASEKLAELRKAMSPEQIAEATKKADIFKPLRQTKYKIGDPPPKLK
jgi:TPR repeat protein